MTGLEQVGVAVTVFLGLLVMAGVAGVLVARYRTNQEDETLKVYKSAIEALKEENDVQSRTIARLEAKIQASDRETAALRGEVAVLRNIVTAKDDIADLHTYVKERFDLVDEGLRDLRGLRGGTRSGEIGDKPSR